MGIANQIKYADRKSRNRAGKTRTATPSDADGAVSAKEDRKRTSASQSGERPARTAKGRGRPVGSPYAGRVSVLIKFDPEAVAWLDGEFVRRKLASRVELIRALVDEAKASAP